MLLTHLFAYYILHLTHTFFCSTFRSRNNDDMRKKSCKKQRGLAVNGCISCTCIRFGIVSYGCCNALDRRGNSQYTSDVHFPRNGRERDAEMSCGQFRGSSSLARDIHGVAHRALKKFSKEQGAGIRGENGISESNQNFVTDGTNRSQTHAADAC